MPPWNLGTGASQAIMAIAGAGLWLALADVDRSKYLILPVAFTIAVALSIDLVYAHYPKPGHVAGVLLGLLIASRCRNSRTAQQPGSAERAGSGHVQLQDDQQERR